VRPSRILVVEDDVLVARAFERQVSRIRPCVLTPTAEGAYDALTKNDRWSGFVIDFMLEGDTGLDVAARVRERYPETPIVIVTAHYGRRDVVNAASRLDCRLVAKPHVPRDLVGFLLDVVAYDLRQHDPELARAVRRIAKRARLSPKESAVLACCMLFESRKDVLQALGVKEQTLKTLGRRMRDKLGVDSLEAARNLVVLETESVRAGH